MTDAADTFEKALRYQLDKTLKGGGNLSLHLLAGGTVNFKQQCEYRLGEDYLTIVGVTGTVDLMPLSAIARCHYTT